jgi:hypothetical protein
MTPCPQCQAPIAEGARFCQTCGFAVAPANVGGALCAAHPTVPAAATCSRCGVFACTACLAPEAEVPTCVACFARGSHQLLPWDRISELGLFKAYWQTTRDLLAAPVKTFSSARPDGSAAASLGYAFISCFLSFSTTAVFYGFMGALAGKESSEALIVIPIMLITFVVLVPLFSVVYMAIVALLDHLVLRLFGATGSYSVTLRASSLSLAPYALGLIPFCGMYVAFVWALVLKVFAFRGLHRVSTGQAVAGALLVTGLGCLVCGGLYAGLIYSIISRGGLD